MKTIIWNMLKLISGKKRYQKMFESMFNMALWGMNYGNAADFNQSGERNTLEYIRQKLKMESDITIFDVGCNTGMYSKFLQEIFNKNITIHAFEPSKTTYSTFLNAINGATNIKPNNFGFNDIETKLALYTSVSDSGLSSVFARDLRHVGLSMEESEIIELKTIDNYCRENEIDHIHLLKMDIEGNELNALKGATEMLSAGNITFIQFEFGGTNIDSKVYFRDFYYLLHGNYRIYRIVKDGLVEISEYNEAWEIFVSSNYLAEKV